MKMNRKSGSRTGIFMMEIMIVVFFFIVCASICINVFVRSEHMSRLTIDIDKGVVAAESIAEVWKAEGFDGLSERFMAVDTGAGTASLEAGACIIYWDSGWQLVTREHLSRESRNENNGYIADISWTTENKLSAAEVKIIRVNDREHLFSLEVKKYLGEQEEGLIWQKQK